MSPTIEIEENVSLTGSSDSSTSSTSSSTISILYDEATKIGEEKEKFYTVLDCVGHSCFYKRTCEGFFFLASGYSPPYEIYEKPLKLSKEETKDIFTDYRSHGYHCSKEITKKEYMKGVII